MDLAGFLHSAAGLLAVPSTADRPDQLLRAVNQVVDYVGGGFTVERFMSNGKPGALLYKTTKRPRFRLILNAHLDVVPAAAEQFVPRYDGNRLYARGAQDMKVSALVQALVFRELAGAVPYPMALQLVADEEIGGRDGTLHQLEQGVTGDFVVIGEQSGLDIVADAKGLVHVVLRAIGRGAHGAYPWLGDNALVGVLATVERLLQRYPVPTDEVWRTTLNVARVATPNSAFNQIPDRAEAWLDLRFPASDRDLNAPVVDVAAFLRTFAAPGVTVEIEEYDPPHHADHERPEIAALRRAAMHQGYRGKLIFQHGAGDGGFFSARGVDTVEFGVAGAGQHGPQEHVEVDSIEPYYRALREFVECLTNIQGR